MMRGWMGLLLSLVCFTGSARANDAGRLDARAKALGNAIQLTAVTQPNQDIQGGRAEGVVDASPADVLAVLYDYGQYAGFLPWFQTSKVLSQRGNDAIVYFEAEVLYGASTIWSQVRMSASSPTPETRVIEAKMMKGKGNMEQLLGRWEVTGVDGGTRTHVAFQLMLDPNLPVPDSVISTETKQGVGHALRALRTRVAQRVYASRANHRM